MNAGHIIFIAEMVGIVAFAISGVLVAIDHRLDLFGAIILGAVTSVGGGMTRDIIIGSTPPVMFTDPTYAVTAAITSIVVFTLVYFVGNRFDLHSIRVMQIVNLFDAIGLGVFVTIGVDAVLAGPMADNAFLAIFIGTITGVGGGVLRDIFVASIPAIFRKHVYAVIAALGSAIYYFMVRGGISVAIALPTAAVVVIIGRLCAAHFRWNFPRIPAHMIEPRDSAK